MGTPLIKWPGGKGREIKYIKGLIPKYDRYVEPFFGGGALFFYLRPQKAIINDISRSLMEFYSLVKAQDGTFKHLLGAYASLFGSVIAECDSDYDDIHSVYSSLAVTGDLIAAEKEVTALVSALTDRAMDDCNRIVVHDIGDLKKHMVGMVIDKMARTVKNERKKPFSADDLKENLITGFASGVYMYFRKIHNDILTCRRTGDAPAQRSANFYFIREYCYGSMFRYNSKGEFNIPYGGMSYNRKDFAAKVDGMFSEAIKTLFAGTEISCGDFEDFIGGAGLTEDDFMFLDPPYDTDFSDYEGKDFTRDDQRRLARTLRGTEAKFMLVIKDTDFIRGLYERNFRILSFDKTYSYNVRSRNDRSAEHLIITNMDIQDGFLRVSSRRRDASK